MNPSPTDTAVLVQRLRRLDACAVSDALDKLQLRGTVTGLRQLSASRRIAGRVTTVKLVRHAEAEAARTGLDAGSWGGILTLGAKLRGVAGVIAEGPVRDIDEARQYDFPVFARGLTAFTARGRVAEIGTQVDITVGDVAVQGNDYVIADNSAVVFIAAGQIDRVLDVAEQIVARESAMAKALLSGEPVSQVMGASYEHMLKN